MKLKILILSLMFLTLTTLNMPALAQSATGTTAVIKSQQTEKINNIKELLAITGTKAQLKQVMGQIFVSMKSQYPQVPQEVWNTFMAEINVDEVINRIIPIYNKYMTNEDIKGLISFYKSPLGRKTTSVIPQLTHESMRVGQQYGIEAGRRTLQKLEAQGYIRR